MTHPNSQDRLSRLYRTLRSEPADELAEARLTRQVMARIRQGEEAAGQPHPIRFRLWPSLAAAAAVALVGLSLVLLRPESVPGGHTEGVEFVRMHANGGVHLEWAGTGKTEYRVLKSTSPSDFSGAVRVRVQGNRYVDQESDSARIVFYRVE